MAKIVILLEALLVALSLASASKRSIYCNPGSTWISTSVAANEVVEVRSQISSTTWYYPNMNCTLMLSAPSFSDRLSINMTALKLNAPDYLMIYDGSDESVPIPGWSGIYTSLQPGSNSYTTKYTSTIVLYMWTDFSKKTGTGFIGDVYVTPAVMASIATTTTRKGRSSSTPSSSSVSISSTLSISLGLAPASSSAPVSSAVSIPSSVSISSAPASSSSASISVKPSSSSASLSSTPLSSISTSPTRNALATTSQAIQSVSSASPPALSNSSMLSPIQTTQVTSSAPVFSDMSSRPRTTAQSEVYIDYLVGSQISAFQIVLPIQISYGDADSRWIQGDFNSFQSSLASVLYCDSDRIQNVHLLPLSRLQSQLQLLILSPRETYKVTAMDIATRFNNQLQSPESDLRHIEVLNLTPDPPVNITMKEILVTVCPNSTYAIEGCPMTNTQVLSASGSTIISSSATVVTIVALLFCIVTVVVVCVRTRRIEQRHEIVNSQTAKGGDTINLEDAPMSNTIGTIGRRGKMSFAVANNAAEYQIKRVPYDNIQLTLASDEEDGRKYVKKRQSSYHFDESNGNISAME